MKSVVLFIALALACVVQCSKILVVFPMAAPSHYILGNALARGLAEAGHDVTMVSPFEEKNPPKKGKYRDVVLTGLLEEMRSNRNTNLPKFFELDKMNPFFSIVMINVMGDQISKSTMKHPNFQKLLKSNEQFDVVIIEQFLDDALKVLAYHYKAPLILLSTIGANAWVNNLVGNPAPLSYVPDVFLSYSSNMTFKQRLVNWLFTVAAELNRHLFYFPAQNKILKEHYPDAPDLSEINYNVSLVLLNSHESVNQAVPHVPNMIDIGGYHVNAPKELPKDLKDFMDSAKEGVVYFSLGSNIQPSQMTEDTRKAILGALGKIKQKVLWKWDEDTLPGKPDNVKISKWFPQQDVLAHPNIRLFITHGGLLSTTETIYHGVPILAFPVFGDQKMNAARAEMNGFGLTLYFSELTEERITDALNKLLNNPQYRENARRRSKLMHDRPVKPLDLAIYWTEFVIRHRGAPHLKVAGADLPLYKYLLLDVISFVILISISSVIVVCFVIKKICSKVCFRKNTKKLKKN
ncbi:hypothetical protein NQ315_011113 [Exocentrus adspersus]|uniref:UDP-glucuronosyltransferase n=1 Tax=Exocentrus adspersus TaxID=1586481 RepID=A0AAV8VWR5_9CUCU|nr:hypothetical protein NQ315_011113 [Exocentrus adspersus]